MVSNPSPLLEAMLILAVQHVALLHSPCLPKYIDHDVHSILYCISDLSSTYLYYVMNKLLINHICIVEDVGMAAVHTHSLCDTEPRSLLAKSFRKS